MLPPSSTKPIATTPKRRPATQAETARILANADRLKPDSHRDSIEELLPPEYFEQFKRRAAALQMLQGGAVLPLAITAVVSQLQNDAALGLLTVEDGETK